MDVDVDVDEDNEEEEWHLNAEEDETKHEIKDVMDIEEIVKEWQMSVPFINQGMKHSCTQFADNTSIPYADEPYFRKPPRIDE
jgi:hypothetical protein